MVEIQVYRPEINTTFTNNSCTHVYEWYLFNGKLKGVRQKPLDKSKLLWFGDGTTIKDIELYDKHIADKIKKNKYAL
jgi:hypothetical protein